MFYCYRDIRWCNIHTAWFFYNTYFFPIWKQNLQLVLSNSRSQYQKIVLYTDCNFNFSNFDSINQNDKSFAALTSLRNCLFRLPYLPRTRWVNTEINIFFKIIRQLFSKKNYRNSSSVTYKCKSSFFQNVWYLKCKKSVDFIIRIQKTCFLSTIYFLLFFMSVWSFQFKMGNFFPILQFMLQNCYPRKAILI